MIDDLNLANASDRHTLRLRIERGPEVPQSVALKLLALLDAAQVEDLQHDLADAESRVDELRETLAAVRRVLARAE